MRNWALIGLVSLCSVIYGGGEKNKRLVFDTGKEIAQATVFNCYSGRSIAQMIADDIPCEHVDNMCDDYLTGYIQALVDMNYYEFQVRVIAREDVVYVFNLPTSSLIANSILCFLYNIPCVHDVQCVNCTPEEFICIINEWDPAIAASIECTTAYISLCDPCAGSCPIHAIWLPQNTVLFQPLIADPRQVMNAAALRFDDNAIGKHVGAVSFGDDFIFIRLKDVFMCGGDMDLGIQAGIFAVFDLDHPEACLVNTDFFVAAMSTYALDNWSYRLRLWHLSSHLGDEFLLSNPEFQRCNLSDEGIDLFASYQLNHAVRLYGGIGYIISRDCSFPEKPFYVEAGTEIRIFGFRDCFNRLYVQPFFAMHFRSWEEHCYELDQTYVLGVEWSKIQGVGRKLRIFLEYHNGFSKEGQFVRERCDYFAVKMTYGF